MIPGVKTIAVLFVLLFVGGLALAVSGEILLAIVCALGLGVLSHIMKKNEKYYDSVLRDMFRDEELN